MTWVDPIVEEVRRVRDAYAARFNYDLWAIYRDLKEQEKKSGRTFVSPPDHTPETESANGPAPAACDNNSSEQAAPTAPR